MISLEGEQARSATCAKLARADQEDEDGEDTGEWVRKEVSDCPACWIGYIVGVK